MPAFTAEGQDAASAAANPALNLEAIGPHHFDTLQVPIVRGRAFTADDRAGVLAVAIVSADVAARTWPGVSPIGRRLKMGGPDSGEGWWTIVGVAAADALPRAGRGAADDLSSLPRSSSIPPSGWRFAPRSGRRRWRRRSAATWRRSIPACASCASRRSTRSWPSHWPSRAFTRPCRGRSPSRRRCWRRSASTRCSPRPVRHRDREIAIRMAVGATPWTIRRLVVAEAVMLAGIGAAAGALGAIVTRAARRRAAAGRLRRRSGGAGHRGVRVAGDVGAGGVSGRSGRPRASIRSSRCAPRELNP